MNVCPLLYVSTGASGKLVIGILQRLHLGVEAQQLRIRNILLSQLLQFRIRHELTARNRIRRLNGLLTEGFDFIDRKCHLADLRTGGLRALGLSSKFELAALDAVRDLIGSQIRMLRE